jgi:hypothetical protein
MSSTSLSKQFYPCSTEGCKRKTTRLTKEGTPYKYCFRCNEDLRAKQVASSATGVCAVEGCDRVTTPMKSDATKLYKNCGSCAAKALPFFTLSEATFHANKAHSAFLSLTDGVVLTNRDAIETKIMELESYIAGIRSVLEDTGSLSDGPSPSKKARTT